MKRPDSLLKDIKRIVLETDGNATVMLFGSYARNAQNADSDIDLLILVDGEKLSPREEDKITFPLYEYAFNEGIIITPLVYTRKAWDNHMVTPFYENVNKEARVL